MKNLTKNKRIIIFTLAAAVVILAIVAGVLIRDYKTLSEDVNKNSSAPSVSTTKPQSTDESTTEGGTEEQTKENNSTSAPESTKAPVSDTSAPQNTSVSLIDTSYAESYSSLMGKTSELSAKYESILKLSNAGYSGGGRQMKMFKLGNGSKKALVVGAIHAREHLTTKYLLKVTEDYCNAYFSESGKYNGYNIKELLSEYTLYIIPCCNPDGLEIIFSRDSAAENVAISALSEYKANKAGIDLNRNFPLGWDAIDNGVTAPADYYFKGYSAGDATETKVLMNLCESNNFEFMLSIHIRGNCIYWGDTYDTSNNDRYNAFARDIANAGGFAMTSASTNPSSYGGGFENWFRHQYKKCGLCIELMPTSYTVKPCGNENYANFNSVVNYSSSSNALAAAMASSNK